MQTGVYVSTSCLRGKDSTFIPDVFKVLNVYKTLGIERVELGSAHTHQVDIQRLLRCKDFQFILHCVFPPLKDTFFMNFASSTRIRQKSVEAAKHSIELCRRLDAPLYSAHVGSLADINSVERPILPAIPKETARRNLLLSLRELCDKAEQCGVRLALEEPPADEPWRLRFTTKEYKDLLKEMNSPLLGLLIDLGHLKRTSSNFGFDPKDYIQELEGSVMEFHVHESSGKKDHLPLKDSRILSRFGISSKIANKAFLTLESNRLSALQVRESLGFLDSALDS